MNEGCRCLEQAGHFETKQKEKKMALVSRSTKQATASRYAYLRGESQNETGKKRRSANRVVEEQPS